jgi:hypothetical protein
MTSCVLSEDPFAFSIDVGTLPTSPTGAMVRQQKMMKLRQLALTRQRNLAKNSACAIQQNNLPTLVQRLPSQTPVFTALDDYTSVDMVSAEAATATTASGHRMSSAADNGLRNAADVDSADERPETASASLDIDFDVACTHRVSTLTLNSTGKGEEEKVADGKPAVQGSGTCWDAPLQGEEVEPGGGKEKLSQSRRFWRPWRSTRRIVSIAESPVTIMESPTLISAFMENAGETDGFENSLSSCSPNFKVFASTRNRAATPWEAVTGMTDDDGLGLAPEFPPGMLQERPPSRIQLPIKPRRCQPEVRDSWVGTTQLAGGAPVHSNSAEDDSAPRSSGQAHQLEQRGGGGGRLRFKLWRKALPEEQPLGGTCADVNKVSSFEVD